jgi:hypothetical protein
MLFTARRIGRQHAATTARVEAALEAAKRIVEPRAGRIGQLEVAVARTADVLDLVAEAHRPLFGRQDPREWVDEPDNYGTTTITATGVLVIVNAQACEGRTAEIDKTLLHELTHAAQYGRRGARDLLIADIANNYGIRALSKSAARASNRRVAADEREAERMERHHRLLAKSI